MLRLIWLAIAALFVTIPCATATIIVASISSTSPWVDRIVRLWGRLLVAAAGVELRTENMGVIDPNRRYVLVANHYSYLDIPCIVSAVPQPIRFMAKASLFKVPIFGWSLSRAGFIPIDRKDRRKAVKSFELAADRIRLGNTIAVFPEEGRSRARQMRPFQRGAFLLAMKAERTIVPMAIDGTYDVFPANRWSVKPGVVTIKVGTPLNTEGVKLREKGRLLSEARAQIHQLLFGFPEPPSGSTDETTAADDRAEDS
jgi:1-acyl-sn-glycerol-3-phosphate acyltransferase